MRANKRTAKWAREYHTVIVGFHGESQQVRSIYVQNDGCMSDDHQRHYPIGRVSDIDVRLIFGLTDWRGFSINSEEATRHYEEELRLKHQR